jgi:Pregnancy-associated plasma protein-A
MFTLKQTLLWAILLVSPFPPLSFAQNAVEVHRNCGSMTHLAEQIAEHPELKTVRERIETQTSEYARRASREGGTSSSVSERSVITIPVVVHVLYNSPRENISDAQVQSQIDALNRDFRKMNAEATRIPTEFQSIAADVNIEFCLAKRQPNGLPTTGIERLNTANTSWQANDDMKRSEQGGLSTWDATKYLNIWVCALNGGALGYATFPGAPLSSDGVVIDYKYFGTYNTRAPFHLGRTATHEVGHWLNLFHIWGDGICGDDHCDDTPTHQGANYGCPTYPLVRTSCGGTNTEMTMNFMDYTNDACMYLFTNSQKARMLSLFAVGGARRGIVEANVCGYVAPSVCTAPTNFSLTNISAQSVTVAWTASTGNATFTIGGKFNR